MTGDRRPAIQPLTRLPGRERSRRQVGAMQQEVAGYLGRLRYERSENSIRGYSNGHRGWAAARGVAQIVRADTQVSDDAEPFHLRMLPAQ